MNPDAIIIRLLGTALLFQQELSFFQAPTEIISSRLFIGMSDQVVATLGGSNQSKLPSGQVDPPNRRLVHAPGLGQHRFSRFAHRSSTGLKAGAYQQNPEKLIDGLQGNDILTVSKLLSELRQP
jgi:hypothetical protein